MNTDTVNPGHRTRPIGLGFDFTQRDLGSWSCTTMAPPVAIAHQTFVPLARASGLIAHVCGPPCDEKRRSPFSLGVLLLEVAAAQFVQDR